MKLKTAILLILLVTLSMGCDRGSNDSSRESGNSGNASGDSENVSGDFEMTVERVDELKGVILKGISVIGTINSGCIATMDKYAVKRDGKKVFETDARILEITNKPGAQKAVKGDYVHLYIPDENPETVKVGDIVTSNTASCGQGG